MSEQTLAAAMLRMQEQGAEPQSNLKARLAQAERRNRWRALALVAPLLIFVLVTFLLPLASMLYRSVHNPLVAESLPQTVSALSQWQFAGLPDEQAYAALAQELISLRQSNDLGKIASRLNNEYSGMRSLMTATARELSRASSASQYSALLQSLDKRWGEPGPWAAIKVLGEPYNLSNYLAALDYTYGADGSVQAQPESRQIYQSLFLRTLGLTLAITGLCLLLGFPLAYLLANLAEKTANLLLILVLLPFWTSLLVRTSAWIVLLQSQGVLNDLLLWLGLIEQRLEMMHNHIGTLVAMTHILLPFMVLPLYSVMKSISPVYLRAARSLGAKPAYAFIKVYLPQTLPGIGAGGLLVFILSVGFYITPALVGGRSGQMISNFIAYHMQTSLNWGLAAALGGLLLALVLMLYALYNRLVGIQNLKVG